MEANPARFTPRELNIGTVKACASAQGLFMFFNLYLAHKLVSVVYDTRMIQTLYWLMPAVSLVGLVLLAVGPIRSFDVAAQEYFTFSKIYVGGLITIFPMLALLAHKP